MSKVLKRKQVRNATNNEITAFDNNAKTVEFNGELFHWTDRVEAGYSLGVYGVSSVLVEFYTSEDDYNKGNYLLGKVSDRTTLLWELLEA